MAVALIAAAAAAVKGTYFSTYTVWFLRKSISPGKLSAVFFLTKLTYFLFSLFLYFYYCEPVIWV